MKRKLLAILMVVMLLFATIPTNVYAANQISTPKITSVSPSSFKSIKVSWESVPGADGYVVYQKNGKEYKEIKTIKGNKNISYTVKGLKRNKKYSFKIKAYDSLLSKKYNDFSNEVSGYTLKKNFKTKITSLTATNSSATIKWKKVKGASGYEIYQKSSGKYKKIKTVSSGTYNFKAKSLKGNTKYTFKVRAFKKSGNCKIYGEYSATKSKRTELATPKISTITPSTTSIKLKWNVSSGSKGYEIYQKVGNGKYKKIKTINKGKTTSYKINRLRSVTKYSFKVRAFKKANGKKVYTDFSNIKSTYTLKKNFKTSITSISSTTSSIAIKWKKVKGAKGYEIFEQKGNGEYNKIKTITKGSTLSYVRNKLSDNTKYSYKVRAYKKSGKNKIYGEFSSVKSKTTNKIYYYNVMFNSNGGSSVKTQRIKSGSYVARPANPTKVSHKFEGWYLDNGTFNNPYSFASPVTNNITLYAKWSEVIEGDATGSDDSVSTYAITGLFVDAQNYQVKAKVSAPENCALLVRFIEEEVYFSDGYQTGDEYIDDGDTFASHVIAAGSDMAEITAEINNSLPENFVAEAVLLNSTGTSVCEPYTTIENTERYEEYDSKTVYDFESNEVVLSFDNTANDNFGVLADDVKIITAQNVEHIDTDNDQEEDAYKIQGASKSFVVGDKIFIRDNNSDHLFRVETITNKGNYLLVIPADSKDEKYGYGVDDFYKYMKVDTNYDSTETQPASQKTLPNEIQGHKLLSNSDPEIVFVNKTVSTGLTFNPVKFDSDNFEFSCDISGTITAGLIIAYDIVAFGEDYLKCELSFSTETTTKLEVKAKAGPKEDKVDKKQKEIKIGKVSIPFAVTGLSAFAEIKAELDWEISAGLFAEEKSTTKSGFTYTTKDGCQKIDSKENDWTVECKGHVEIKFGPKPAIGIQFLEGALSCGVECFFGAVFEADVVLASAGGQSVHACQTCVNGEIKAQVTVDVYLEYDIGSIEGRPFDYNIVNYEVHLFKFYLSIKNDADSLFEGHLKAGIGECPNKRYLTKIYAKNSQNQDVNTSISVYKKDSNTVAGNLSSGNAIFLYPGNYIAKATIGGNVFQKEFTINDSSKEVTISTIQTNSFVSGSVKDVYGDILENAQIKIYENTTFVASATTDSNGAFKIPLEPGTYRAEVTCEGYISASQNFTVANNENKYIEAFKLSKIDNEYIMGGIYGTIKDAISGEELEDVEIKISRGWGNNTESTPVVETTTDYYGEYDYTMTEIHGVYFGLDAGNYTVSISKEGYIPTSFNITVTGGEDMEFNSTITPIGAENIYRIVLTWGSTPMDLDSHLNAETEDELEEHIFFGDVYGYNAFLDVDDTTSYGPETITIKDITKYDGNIFYSVHDYTNRSYSNSTSLSNSNACVKIYKGGELLKEFFIPTGVVGTVWNVFYIDSQLNIHTVNSFENISDPDSVNGSTN